MRTNQNMINPFCAGCERGATEICCINSASRFEFTLSYIKATKILANSILGESQACLFHPLAFMIRHSIELVIKNELIEKCGKTRQDVLPVGGKLKTHDLENLSCNLKHLSDNLLCDTSLRNYLLKDEIELFDQYDKGSYEFRYPIKTDGTNSCNDLCCFGIKEVIEICDNLEEFLKNEYPDKFSSNN